MTKQEVDGIGKAITAGIMVAIEEILDVPLVEDLPLDAHEETLEFRNLALLLRLRSLRALEHWRGNTATTLADLLQRTVVRMDPGGAESEG